MTEPVDLAAEELERARTFFERAGPQIPLRDIPDESIARWTAIPENAPVVLNLTRGEVDHLYFTMQAMQTSIIGFQMSMAAWIAGNPEAANLYYQGCIVANSKASTRLVDFMDAVMRQAEVANGE